MRTRILFAFISIISQWVLPVYALTQEKEKIVILASGSELGIYYQTGEIIKKSCANIFKSLKIINVQTSGSLQNLEMLQNNIADFSILQRDVAVKSYYRNQNPIKNFEIVMPLFPEALQIFIHGKPGHVEFSEFLKAIQNEEIKKLAIGEPESTSNLTVRSILNLFGVNRTENFFDERPFKIVIDDLKKGNISALAFITGYPLSQLVDDSLAGKIGFVSMDESQVSHILSHLNNLDRIEFAHNIYPFLKEEKKPIFCVGTWAFLVSRSGFMEQLNPGENGSFIEQFVHELYKTKSNSPLYSAYSNKENFQFVRAERDSQVRPRFKNFSYFFRGLPISQEFKSYFTDTETAAYLYLMIGLIPFILLLLLILKYKKKIDFFRYWIRYKHFIYALTFLIVGFFIVSYLILFLEKIFFLKYSVKSQIVDINILDVQVWLFVFALTSFNNNIFPLSFGGQLLTTVATYLGWIATFFSVGQEFVFNYNRRKRRMGMKKLKCEGHLCICGFNDSVKYLIKNSISALKSSFLNNRRKVIIISPKFKEYLEKDAELKRYHDCNELEYIDGEARDVQSLELANLLFAKTVILLSDDGTLEADERTLLRALAISKYAKEHASKSREPVYIIAEINRNEFKSSLLDADVNEVICSSNIIENLIIHSMLNHGVANVFSNLLIYNESNEVYIIDIQDYPSLKGKTFDDLLFYLRPFGIQLIAIQVVFFDENNLEIIDKKEIEERLKANGLKVEYIINPTIKNELQYRTSATDHLLVFTLDEKSLKRLKEPLINFKASQLN